MPAQSEDPALETSMITSAWLSSEAGHIAAACIQRRRLVLTGRWYCSSIDYQPRLMPGAPFGTRAAHVVQLGTVTVAHVQNQVANDAGEVRGRLSRPASTT
ncbi:hypothetical protein AC630_38255 [Bradyrhizobium sp. AS23.2]|nr:hypothetical protein AC630_38255 [Bradyrhizobium sp. AS23.2]